MEKGIHFDIPMIKGSSFKDDTSRGEILHNYLISCEDLFYWVICKARKIKKTPLMLKKVQDILFRNHNLVKGVNDLK